MTIADLIRKARERLGVSQDKLALAISVTNATVSHWETGKSIPARVSCEILADYCEKKGLEEDLVAAIRNIRADG